MKPRDENILERITALEFAIARLEARIARLERTAPEPAGITFESGVAAPPRPAVPSAPPVVPTAGRPMEPSVRAATTPAPAARGPQLSAELEVAIGTSWLNRLGIIAIIAAAAYFLKYAFDNQWVGPAGRVVLTSLFGTLLLTIGERYQQRRLSTFAQGLSGGGIAVLYFAVYAAFQIYRLVPLPPAFAMSVVVTVAAVLLALRYESPAIASLGIIGGFAAPLALGGGGNGGAGVGGPVSVGLYLYFLMLDAATYVVAQRTQWRTFGGIGLAAGFLAPIIVASAANPHPVAALVYFLVMTVATLALSMVYGTAALALVALIGGFFLSALGGAYTVFGGRPYVAMAYFGMLTIAAVVVAGRQDWKAVALVATAGGMLTTIAMGPKHPLIEFVYLAVLAGAALSAGVKRSWRSADLVVLGVGALASFITLLGDGAPTQTWQLLTGTALLFLLFSLTSAWTSHVHTEQRLLTVILAAAVFAGQIAWIIGWDRRDALVLVAVVFAAYHVAAARAVLRRQVPRLTPLVLLGLAVTFLTIAVPLKLHQEAIALAWSVEGLVLAWAAARTNNAWAARAATVVGVLAAVRLVLFETPLIAGARLVFSAAGFAFLVGIAALAMQAILLRHQAHDPPMSTILGGIAAAQLLWWGGWEIDGVFRRLAGTFGQAAGAKQATLSAWFTLYGFGLILVGIWKTSAPLRWAGIGLLAVTAVKVFVIDLAAVAVAFRIFSLAVLGGLLILASLAYSRYRARLTTTSGGKGSR